MPDDPGIRDRHKDDGAWRRRDHGPLDADTLIVLPMPTRERGAQRAESENQDFRERGCHHVKRNTSLAEVVGGRHASPLPGISMTTSAMSSERGRQPGIQRPPRRAVARDFLIVAVKQIVDA